MLIIIAVIAAGAVSAAVWFYQFTLGNGCVILALTGIPCPTCGMTRATLCFLTGRFREAFYYQPLLPVPYSVIALCGLCVPMKKHRRRLCCCVIVMLAAYIAVWIIRVAFFGWRG